MHAINEEAVIDKLFGGARNRSVINEEDHKEVASPQTEIIKIDLVS